MGFSSFNYGANVVSLIKNNQKFGMICAWAMQADYDKVLLLLGAQSITGKQIQKGDIIGVSALSSDQEEIVNRFGNYHSDEIDKFANVEYTIHNTAILINDASNQMVVEVIDVLHLEGIEADHLVYGLIKSFKDNNKPKFSLEK